MELHPATADRRRAILAIGVLAFFVLASYELTRPVVVALFLDSFSSRWLPGAWAAVAALTLVTVAIYNHFSARVDLIRLMFFSALASAAALTSLWLALRAGWGGATFLLYLWKDVYIVVLVEILWSFANVVLPLRVARRTYGAFCVVGSLGSICGLQIVEHLVHPAGPFSPDALVPLPLVPLAAVALVAWLLLRRGTTAFAADAPRSLGAGLSLLRRSPYLGWMVALIGTVQVVITLTDYLYNSSLEQAFASSMQASVIAEIYLAISISSLLLQALTGPIVRLLGTPAVLIAIPCLLGALLGSFFAVPTFGVIAVAKVAGKALDYSLFRAAKEVLYIPLSYGEKTQGKAVVDILTYRVAKGGASLLLLAMVWYSARNAPLALALALTVGWIVVTVAIGRRYRGLVSREEEQR